MSNHSTFCNYAGLFNSLTYIFFVIYDAVEIDCLLLDTHFFFRVTAFYMTMFVEQPPALLGLQNILITFNVAPYVK